MTEKAGPLPSSLTKGKCCEARLVPLLQRIQSLQRRLVAETYRREKDYNQILRMMIIGKKGSLAELSRTTDKVEVSKMTNKSAFKDSKLQGKIRASPSHTAPKEIDKQDKKDKSNIIRKASTRQLRIKRQAMDRTDEHSPVDFSKRLAIAEQRIANHESQLGNHAFQLNKGKELNDYLMDQLLSIFQRLEQANVKQQLIPSLQTLSSMVVDQESKSQHINIINNQRNSNKNTQLTNIYAKLAQHQTVLSELIQLTRDLSSQIRTENAQSTAPSLPSNFTLPYS